MLKNELQRHRGGQLHGRVLPVTQRISALRTLCSTGEPSVRAASTIGEVRLEGNHTTCYPPGSALAVQAGNPFGSSQPTETARTATADAPTSLPLR
ncbi:hypothetical protein [Dendronalium sp. ChiSLP03b]|uniref:hypothetical protein n=1 Tax=Dendronalium sp. ChiSLP03b TaxID=3075381 RepID=UPI003919D310